MVTRYKRIRITSVLLATVNVVSAHVRVGVQATQYERLSVAQKRLVEQLSKAFDMTPGKPGYLSSFHGANAPASETGNSSGMIHLSEYMASARAAGLKNAR